MKELVQWARALKNEHPDKFDEIWELVDLCYNEIEQGGSPEHEIELCKDSIIQLLDDDTED
jgi:transcription elongation factor GreA-like protein